MTETITGTNRSAGVSFTELLDRTVASGVRRAARRVARRRHARATPGFRRGTTRRPSSTRSRSRSSGARCGSSCLPRGRDPRGRRLSRLRDRRLSFLVVRTDDGIKAYRNACLHRGRLLRETHGKGAKNLRCAFHGWAWHLDGHDEGDPVRVGLPERAQGGLLAARGARRHVARLRVHQPRPRRRTARRPPRRSRRPLRQGTRSSSGTRRHTSRRSCASTGRPARKRSWRRYHVVATHPTLMEDLGDANTPLRHLRQLLAGDLAARRGEPAPRRDAALRATRRRQAVRPVPPPDERPHLRARRARGSVRVVDLDGNESLFDDEATLDRRPDQAGRPAPVQVDRWSDARAGCSMCRSPSPTRPRESSRSPTCERGSPTSVEAAAAQQFGDTRRRRAVQRRRVHRRDVLLGVPELVALGRVQHALLPVRGPTATIPTSASSR